MDATTSTEWFFFDRAEESIVRRVLDTVAAATPEQASMLRANLARLRGVAEIIRDSPSITMSWHARGQRDVSGETLIDVLCRVPDYDLDLHIPTKAVLGQAYLIAKINFFKALGYALEPLDAPVEMSQAIEQELGQSIYSKLAEELFISIVTDAGASYDVKAGAARSLFRIWEERLNIEVDDFAPLLESVWRARSRLLPVLGTMLGTQEAFRLFNEARDHRFLDYFGGDDVDEEQVLAFEELLFGLSHEEIVKLREHMRANVASCVTLEEARALLGRAKPSWMSQSQGAQALYTSYKKRRVKALYRALTGASGPKKTAEEYLMIALLGAGGRPSLPRVKIVPQARG
jgi:hypothetical protein